MKVHSNFAGQTSKHRLLALSCATALASFAFIAKPALAEEATADSTANLDTRATTTANVETTADLVETKVVDAKPATEATANTSEEAASVNTDAGTNLTTVTVSQEQTPDQPAIATNAVEAQATNTESSASTGHYYSDDKGNWYYKDANGENLKGAQTIDGQNVYFENNGRQVKGDFAEDGYYYDGNSGQRVTNSYVRRGASLWFYVDAEGRKLFGEQTINNQDVYFDQNYGTQVKGNFASNGYYYDEDSGARVDFGKNQFVKVDNNWYYVDNQGKIVKGAQTIDGKLYYFIASGASKYIQYGKQVKGEIVDFVANSNIAPVYSMWNKFEITRRYYFDENTGEAVIDGQVVYLYESGKQAKGELIEVNGVPHYYDANTGARVSNAILTIKGKTYQFDADGNGKLVG